MAFACPGLAHSYDAPCPCGCPSPERCYVAACNATSRAIRNAPRDELDAVYVTGMAALGQSPRESARHTHPIADHGAGEEEGR